jgi:predicted metal-dependent HD superfamily phosphohydrolase
MFDFSPQNDTNQLLFDKVQTMYAESQRHYHNLVHIENLLKLSVQYKTQITDLQSVYFAIWFHDCVYNPLKNDNEEQSAVIAQEYLTKLFANDTDNNKKAVDIDKITKYILATKSHSNPDNDSDLQWFLDFDLSVLGMDTVIYDTYALNIRKEYSHVPMWKYRIGRRKVLKYFLGKPLIFKCLPSEYEKQARINLFREYKSLQWKFW